MTHRIRTDPTRLPTDHHDGFTPSKVSPGYERPRVTAGWTYSTVTHLVLVAAVVALFLALVTR